MVISRTNLTILGLLCGLGLGCEPGVPAGTPQSLVPSCVSVADGSIDAAELPTAAGLRIRYVANQPGEDWPERPGPGGGDNVAPVDRDFRDGPDDIGATFPIVDPATAWWGSRFPEATYASPTSVAYPGLLGVYRASEIAVDLLGYVTAEEQPPASRTEVHYDEPVTVLQLPLRAGMSWGQQSHFRDGVIAGVPEQAVEDWEFSVGEPESALITGDIELRDVLPVSSTLTQNYALSTAEPGAVTYSTLWLAPCFGELASVQSGSEGPGPVRTYRRYAP